MRSIFDMSPPVSSFDENKHEAAMKNKAGEERKKVELNERIKKLKAERAIAKQIGAGK